VMNTTNHIHAIWPELCVLWPVDSNSYRVTRFSDWARKLQEPTRSLKPWIRETYAFRQKWKPLIDYANVVIAQGKLLPPNVTSAGIHDQITAEVVDYERLDTDAEVRVTRE